MLLVDINEEAVAAAASKLAQKFPEVKVLAARADVGREADIKAAVDKAVAEFGRLDIMVSSLSFTLPTIRTDRPKLSSTTQASCTPPTTARSTLRSASGT